jgi:hypothetical protein
MVWWIIFWLQSHIKWIFYTYDDDFSVTPWTATIEGAVLPTSRNQFSLNFEIFNELVFIGWNPDGLLSGFFIYW